MSKTAPPQTTTQTEPTPLETIAELRQRIDETRAGISDLEACFIGQRQGIKSIEERVKRIEEAMTFIASNRERIEEAMTFIASNRERIEEAMTLHVNRERIEEAMTLHVNRERPKLAYSQAPGVPQTYAPEMRSDGMLLLKYAPRSGGQRNVQAGDSITLPTGVIVQAPPGHLVAVAQRRKHGEGFIFQNVVYLDSAKHTELDILCSVPPKTITAHTSSRTESFVPGEVIGAAWLIAETAMPDTTKPSH